MTPRRVRFTATAQRHLERERTWWRKNRDSHKVFEIALNQELEKISFHPETGKLHGRSRVTGVRRTLVAKISCHLYYTADDRSITIRALWGARRGNDPPLS